MTRRLVERFAVGAPVEVRLASPRTDSSRAAGDDGGDDRSWVPAVVVRHAHPGVWIALADGSRWFMTNGGRIRERTVRAASGPPTPAPAVAYKIASAAEWEATERTGAHPGSAADLQDGYVHLSTASQVRETAAKHFAGREDLVLLDVALDRLDAGTLRWEPSRGGALFPHVYGALRRSAVLRVRPLPPGADGRHSFPPDVT
jgi:uncharacterized protein (DUF952 family)